MKKCRIFLFIFIVKYNSIYCQENFKIEGIIKNHSPGYIYLFYPSVENTDHKDSSKVSIDGKFSFTGRIYHPVAATLTLFRDIINVENPNVARIFISPGNMSIEAHKNNFKRITMQGSPQHDELAEMNSIKDSIYKRMEPLKTAYDKERVLTKRDSLVEELQTFYREMADAEYAFLVRHPSSYLTAYMMSFYMNELPLNKLELHYAGFGEKIKQSSYGIRLKQQIDDIKSGSPGGIAQDFSALDINGKKITLSSYKEKKYVLIDFWASWCVPCRLGNPHLRKLYAKYSRSGFEIIGVSDDDNNPAKWRKAVQNDSLEWVNVLRGKEFNKIRRNERNENDISQKYGVQFLPTKILIDKKGVVIGRFNEEEDSKLDSKLKEIFGF